MKKITAHVIAVIGMALIMHSCSKENASNASKTQLLTQKSWRLTGARSQINGGLWNDDFAIGLPCVKDNIWTFTTAGTYIVEEGATKCNGTDPQVISSGTWVFTNNETNLVADILGTAGSGDLLNILTLDQNTLKLGVQSVSGSTIRNFEVTFGH